MNKERKSIKLPRFRMPPPGKRHGDAKKEASKRACRRPERLED